MRLAGLIGLSLILTACTGTQKPAPVAGVSSPATIKLTSHTEDAQEYQGRKKLADGSYEVQGIVYYPLKTSRGFTEQGIASWYGPNFHGKKTANGEDYDMERMTAAHPTLPLPTFVEVLNRKTGKKLVVRVNDRGPFHDGRIIDLSHAAARALDVVQAGTAPVQLRALNEAEIARLQQQPEYHNHPQLFIQLAAFNSAEMAQQQQHKLKRQLNLPLQVSVNSRTAIPIHILRIGPLADMTAANQTLSQVRLAGLNKAFIRME